MLTIEHTDTFQGEANYSWVNRWYCNDEVNTRRQRVLLAKRLAGLTGVPCRVENYGDMLTIRPRGCCQVIFIAWEDWRTPDEARAAWRCEVNKSGEEV